MGLVLAFPAVVWSQTNSLQGQSDIHLSGALPGDQAVPSVAFGPNGGFIVWQDNITDPGGLGISARRLSAGLVPIGEVIHVNQTLGHDQQRAKVAMLNDGGAVTVYQSGRSGAQNVLARFLTAGGGFAGNEIVINNPAVDLVNRYQTNWVLIRNNRPRNQKFRIREKIKARQDFNANPAVVTLRDGSVVSAYASSRIYTTNTFGLRETLRWHDRKSIFITNRVRVPLSIRAEGMQDVYLQRLSASGQKLGEEVRVNQFLDFNQRDVALAPLDNGNFVVVWVSEQQPIRDHTAPSGLVLRPNSVDVYARVFDALGHTLSDEILVNTGTLQCGSPSITGLANGGFTVAWSQRSAQRNSGVDIVARTFDQGGTATSAVFPANTVTFGDQFAPSVVNAGSQQVIVWSSMGQDGSWEGVFARAFQGATAVGDEFRVNVSTPFSQKHSGAASDGLGRVLLHWSGYSIESGFDLFGRMYVAP